MYFNPRLLIYPSTLTFYINVEEAEGLGERKLPLDRFCKILLKECLWTPFIKTTLDKEYALASKIKYKLCFSIINVRLAFKIQTISEESYHEKSGRGLCKYSSCWEFTCIFVCCFLCIALVGTPRCDCTWKNRLTEWAVGVAGRGT